jgi:hypothetical protein
MTDQLQPLDPKVADTIKQVAATALPPASSGTTHLALAPGVYPAGHTFVLPDGEVTVRQTAALVLVDQNPGANWGHPCAYHFHDPTNGALLYTQPALFPPNLKGDVAFETFHAPLATRAVAAPKVAQTVDWRSINGTQLVSAAQEERYAVLFTSQISDRRHVDDLEFLWRTLVEVYGFAESCIYVLCYNGTIGSVDVPPNQFTEWPGNNTPYRMKVHGAASTANLDAVFTDLAGKLKPDDLLLVHTNNHGAPSGLCVDESTVIAPGQFGSMIAKLPQHKSLVVTMEQCYSGAFQATVTGQSPATNTVFASAVPASLESAGGPYFDPWALALIEALRGSTPSGAGLPSNPDTNHDGLVSIVEARTWANAHDTASSDQPQYADRPAGCGNSIFLGLIPAGRWQGLAEYDNKLYAAWKGETGDDRLFFSDFNSGAWAQQQQIPGVASSVGPALATLGGELYAAWKGMNTDQSLWWSRYDGSSWAAQAQIPGTASLIGPAVAAFNGALYAAWRGMSNDESLWWSRYNGTAWAQQQQIPGVASSVGPALAVYDGALFAAWKGMEGDQGIWWSKFEGTHWAPQQEIPGVASSVGPTLAAFDGQLYAAWKGMSEDQGIWWSKFDGTHWAPQQEIPGVASSIGPALGVFGTELYAIWKGMSTDQRIWWSRFDGSHWAPQATLPGNTGPDPIYP